MRNELYVKCNDFCEYTNLMNCLETLDFKWAGGDKPTKWNFYSHCKINTQLSVVIVINLKLKDISYIPNHSTPPFEYIFCVDGVKYQIKDYLMYLNKKSFGELKCGDFPNCQGCPFKSFTDCPIEKIDRTFNEEMERLNKLFEEAKEAYEKGDK